jgi:hypothetical protein
LIDFNGVEIRAVIFEGLEARAIANKTVLSNSDSYKIKLLQAAASACHIPYFRIFEKTRRQDVVWARYLVMYYLHKIKMLSDEESANVFKLDRCTALHAVKRIKQESKYIQDDHCLFRNIFFAKLKEINLITDQIYVDHINMFNGYKNET